MCLYVNKQKTLDSKPKTVKTYYKLVRCQKYSDCVRAPYQGNDIESGWYKPLNEIDIQNPELQTSINGGIIHVFCTRKAAEKCIKKGQYHFIIEVRCYPEDFVAFGSMSINTQKTSPQAAYKKIFIQEDDLRNIIRKQNRVR